MAEPEQGSPRTLLLFVGLAFIVVGAFVLLRDNGFFEQYKHLGQQLDQAQGGILMCLGVIFASISTKLSSLPFHEGRQTATTQKGHHEKQK